MRQQRSVRRRYFLGNLESLEARKLLTTMLVDLDGDSDLDAIRGGYWYENQTGDGDFLAHLFANEATVNQTIHADLDRDGDPDLVTSDGFWFENNGSAEFTARALPGMDDQSVLRIQASDVGMDGNVDLLFFGQNNVTFLRNTDGAGNFVVEVSLATPGLIDAGDIDADNDLDLLASHTDGVFHVDWNVEGEFEREVVLEDQTFDFSSLTYSSLSLTMIDDDQQLDLAYRRYEASFDHYSPQDYYWRRLTGVHSPRLISRGCGEYRDGTFGIFHLSDWDDDGDLDSWCSAGTRDLNSARLTAVRNSSGKFTAASDTEPSYPERDFEYRSFSDAGDINGDTYVDYVSNLLTAGGVPGWIDGVTGEAYQLPLSPIYAEQPVLFGAANSYRDIVLANIDKMDGPEAIFVSEIGVEIWKFSIANGTEPSLVQSIAIHDAQAIEVGDLDSDGSLDLAVATKQANLIFRNDGSGKFVDDGQTLGDDNTWDLAMGDVDADGDLDLFFANFDSLPNQIWLNDGRGNFANSGQSLGHHSSTSAAFGDVDEDGDLDLVVGNVGSANQVWVNRDGVFWPGADSDEDTYDQDTYDIALADFDRDNQLDQFRVNSHNGPAPESVNGFRLSPAGIGRGGAIGDIDNDADFDVIVANGQFQPNVAWINDGQSYFHFLRTADTFDRFVSNSVALGDVDLDGDLDVIFANDGQNALYLNQTNPDFPTSPLLPPRPVPLFDDPGNQNSEATLIQTPVGDSVVTATGTINLDGDVDVFRFSIDRRSRYQISVNGANFRVVDHVGRWIRGETLFYNLETSEFFVHVTGEVGANYELRVHVENNDHGHDRFGATPLSPEAQFVEGEIIAVDDVDYFVLQPQVGEWYQFILDSRTPGFLPDVRLRGGVGGTRARMTQRGPSRLTLEHIFTDEDLRLGNRVYLEIAETISFWPTGQYRLFVQRLDENTVEPPDPFDPVFEQGRPGDANRDGVFDSADFVQVFQAGQFEDEVRGNSIWETGDWNDDGDFDSADLVYAFTFGVYQK
ncbi:MAG: FG-GAP-like repeat-containing protein [Pirellulaceae bacterium]